MSAFKIESGVPTPEGQKNHRYPFADMKVGDSFVFPSSDVTLVRTAAGYWAIRHPGFGYKTRKIMGTDNHRIWRVEPKATEAAQ